MSTPSFEDQVNDVVTKSTVDDKGNLQLPEGTTAAPEVMYAAKLAKRHRDTQSSFTKSQQRVKALEAENSKLATGWEADATSKLSSQEQTRLEELKTQDPDAWRAEITKVEETKRQEFKTRRETISTEANQVSEIERRGAVLTAFNEANPTIAITDDVITNDLPPRITKKLETGDITFEDFLDEAKNYLTKGKALAPGAKAPDEPNFAGARGTGSPTKEAVTAQNAHDYNQEIF